MYSLYNSEEVDYNNYRNKEKPFLKSIGEFRVNIYDIRDYGAVSDSGNVCTDSIQRGSAEKDV